MASPTVSDRLGEVKGKPLKVDLGPSKESFRETGQLVEQARMRRGWSSEEMAAHLGIAPSLYSKQVSAVENNHLSFQRLRAIEDEDFQRELLVVQIKALGLSPTLRVEWPA